MNAPTLWIGVPSYNHARYLPVMLDALLAQSYQPLGITVIDDCSTDESVAIVRSYARRYPQVRLIVHERNLGVNATLKELLEMAIGDFFFAPAVDDRVLPGMLEKSMALLARHPTAGLCSAQIYAIDQIGLRTKLEAANPLGLGPEGYYMSPAQCRTAMRRPDFWVHGNTAIFRREALLAAGGYRKELGYYADGLMHLTLALAHGACFVPEPLGEEMRLPDTYSGRSQRNPAGMRRIRDTALGLMRGENARLFPRWLVRRWQGRWDFWRTMAQADHQFVQWQDGIRAILEPGDRANGGLLAAGLRIVRWARAWNRLAGLLLLTPFDFGTVARAEILPRLRRIFPARKS